MVIQTADVGQISKRNTLNESKERETKASDTRFTYLNTSASDQLERDLHEFQLDDENVKNCSKKKRMRKIQDKCCDV